MLSFCCNFNDIEDIYFSLGELPFNISYNEFIEFIKLKITNFNNSYNNNLNLILIDEDDNIYNIIDDVTLSNAINKSIDISGSLRTIHLKLTDNNTSSASYNNGLSADKITPARKKSNSVPSSPSFNSLNSHNNHVVEEINFPKLIPLMISFFSDTNIQQAIRRSAPLAVSSLKSGSAIQNVITNILMLEPVIANSDLVMKVLPTLPAYYSRMNRVNSKLIDLLVQLPPILPVIPKLLGLISSFAGTDSSFDLSALSGLSLGDETNDLFQSLASVFSTLSVAEEKKEYTVTEPVSHSGYECVICKITPILGNRYYCSECEVSLCEPCELAGKHDQSHSLTKIKQAKRHNAYLSDDLAALSEAEKASKPSMSRSKYSCCFIEDITIRKGSVLEPNQILVKTWNVCNDGSEMWPEGVRVVEVSGDKLTNTREVFPAQRLTAGAYGEVSVCFETPEKSGYYVSHFSLIANGRHFGEPLEIDICVMNESEEHLSGGIINEIPSGSYSLDLDDASEEDDVDLGLFVVGNSVLNDADPFHKNSIDTEPPLPPQDPNSKPNPNMEQ